MTSVQLMYGSRLVRDKGVCFFDLKRYCSAGRTAWTCRHLM